MKSISYSIIFLLMMAACQQNTTKDNHESAGNFLSRTIVNPVLPGDRPDPTVIQFGEEFYVSTSSN